ncbi:MAG: DNA polymerase I [Actinobacteria bacterium]|nr:MAG: DNA polymerase I [Actinomycetota bacterium]
MQLMVLDGNSLAYRAFFALPTDMKTASGQVTNSVYGFCSMLLTLIKDHKPDGVIVVFDRKEPTFRHVAAPEYKAQREAQPDILYQQMDIIKQMLEVMGIAAIDAAGFEGDDLIATIAEKAEQAGEDLLIVTGDRDTYQLVRDPHIRVLYNKRGVSEYALYDEAGIMERTGVTPAQYAQYAALRGDPSDNLDGVPGVGEKTAAKLMTKYLNIVSVFDAAEEQTPKLKQGLLEARERVLRNAQLMVLRRDAPVAIDITQTAPRPRMNELKAMFETLEFKSMFARAKTIFGAGIDSQNDLPVNQPEMERIVASVAVCDTVKSARDTIAKISKLKSVDIGVGWAGEPGRSALDGIAIVIDAVASKVAWIATSVLQEPTVLSDVADLVNIRAHNAKPLLRWLIEHGVDLRSVVVDTAIAAYLLDPSDNKFEIQQVLSRYTNRSLDVGQAEESGQLDFGSVGLDQSSRSCAEALAVGLLANPILHALDTQGVAKLFADVEMPLVRVLAQMEKDGVAVDVEQLTTINDNLKSHVERLTALLHKLAGRTFNINSPTQLREILFDEKNLAPGKKTKTGFSTDAATLEKIRDQWPEFIDPLLEYREFEKLRSTYGQGLLDAVGADGRIHATFNQTVARTGRLSSDQPNLHNIPVRSEQGKVFRTAFVPSAGCEFLVADYNQIELRCIAHLANDPGLIDAFTRGIDVHSATASRLFGVNESEVSSEQRSQSKMVSYGLAYGMEAYGLSQRLNVGVGEAAQILDAYFVAFPNVKNYMDSTVEEARKRGYTETLFGRRRPIPELNSSNFRIRQAGERQAMNAGIQGLAADIFKIALVRIVAAFETAHLKSRVILQVHDEVIIEAVVSEKSVVEDIVLTQMKQAASLKVPLEVHSAWGTSWASAKG